MDVQGQANFEYERVKIFEFFGKAAELLGFDVELIGRILTEPWEIKVAAEEG